MNCYPIHKKNRYAITPLNLDHTLNVQNAVQLDLCTVEERNSIIIAHLDAAQALMLAVNTAAWDNDTPIHELYRSHAKTAAHFCRILNGKICVHVAGRNGYVFLSDYLHLLNQISSLPEAVRYLIQALAEQCCDSLTTPICSYSNGCLWTPVGTRNIPINRYINRIAHNHTVSTEARLLISALVLQAGAIDIRRQAQELA